MELSKTEGHNNILDGIMELLIKSEIFPENTLEYFDISKESIFEALNNPLKVEKNKIDKIGSYIHIFCKFNVFESKTVNVFYLNIVFNDYVDKTVSMW